MGGKNAKFLFSKFNTQSTLAIAERKSSIELRSSSVALSMSEMVLLAILS